MGTQPVLDPAHRGIAVIAPDRKDRETGLEGAGHLQDERFGAADGDLASAELLDDVEGEVDRRIEAAAAEHAAVLGDAEMRLPIDLRKAPAIELGDGPMGGRAPPVEETGFGEYRDAGADAGNQRPLGMEPLQPRDGGGILGKENVDVHPGGRHEDEIGLLHRVERLVGEDLHACPAGDGRSIDRRRRDPEIRLRRATHAHVPHQTGGVEDFEGCNRRGYVAVRAIKHRHIDHFLGLLAETPPQIGTSDTSGAIDVLAHMSAQASHGRRKR